jgi:hypothetical protein
VAAADASPTTYQSYTCPQLIEEAHRLSQRGRHGEYGPRNGAIETILNVSIQKNCRDPILAGIAAGLRQDVERNPKQEIADYVVPVQYQKHTCPRLNEEAERLSARMKELMSTLEFKGAQGVAAASLFTIVYYPVGALVYRITPAVDEARRVDEEQQSVIKVSIKKNCEWSRWRPWPRGKHPSLSLPFERP